jgi:hypothetical protein
VAGLDLRDKETKMQILAAYLVVAGGISASLQVARGMVRGTGRLLAGDPRGALGEVAGGLLAPAAQVYKEVGKRTIDVIVAAQALTNDTEEPTPEGVWAQQRNGVPI